MSAIAHLTRRIRLAIGRGVLNVVDDALRLQGLQITALADETWDRVERFQEYGFTSNPLPGAEAIIASVGGRRNHAVAVAVDDRRYRKRNLLAGEVALYTHLGDYIHLKNGRIVEIVAGTRVRAVAPEVEVVASTKVTLTTPLTEVSGNMTVGGSVTVTGAVNATGAIVSATSVADPSGPMSEMRNVYNTHTHPENGSGGGTTSQPTQQMT